MQRIKKKLMREKGCKEAELEGIKKTSIQEMWLNELIILKKKYINIYCNTHKPNGKGKANEKIKTTIKNSKILMVLD